MFFNPCFTYTLQLILRKKKKARTLRMRDKWCGYGETNSHDGLCSVTDAARIAETDTAAMEKLGDRREEMRLILVVRTDLGMSRGVYIFSFYLI
jgi:hypothetical protein